MDIRFASEGDISGMLSLLLQVGQVHHVIRPDIFPPAALKYDEAALVALLKDESRPVFVAAEGEFVAGYCFCQLRSYEGSGISTRIHFGNRLYTFLIRLCIRLVVLYV